MKPRTSKVLLIDDRPDTQEARSRNLRQKIDATLRHPQDIRDSDLTDADLILIDYRLEIWPERSGLPLSLQPLDGIALSSIIRSHLRHKQSKRATAIAIHSAHLTDLSGPFPEHSREHLIAELHNLEWAFPKTVETARDINGAIADLANAAASLPQEWPRKNPMTAVADLLKLPKSKDWHGQALSEIEACRPPVYDFSEVSQGIAFLRWLLHRILSYPCFLANGLNVAARFGTTEASFAKALTRPRFKKALAQFEYIGTLSNFSGRRWWRPGIDWYLWKITEGQPLKKAAVHAAVKKLLGVELEPLSAGNLVLCVDENLEAEETPSDVSLAVRIQPDDWPAFAETPWCRIEKAIQNPGLAALVIFDDRDKLAKP